MKTKKIAVLLLTLVLTMVLSPMSVFAAKRDVVEGSTASITVENAVKGDELKAYKIIDITYNATTNNLTYAWNSDFADYFTNKNKTIEQFAAMETDSAELKNLLAGLPKFIADNGITTSLTATADNTQTATFSNLAMGEYFIRPTTTTSVYQLMLQKVEPTANNGKYVIDDTTFTAKREEVTVTKTADKTSVTKGEKVNYTITVNIPTYGTGATDKSFYVSDLFSDGLTLDINSISATIEGTTVNENAYTLDTKANTNYTFKFSVSTEQYTNSWSANAGKKLVITYSATFNNDDTTAVNVKETNTATFNYSNYPYVSGSNEEKTSEVEVNTFAIKINKHVTGDESKKLADAEFDLYRTATPAEITAGLSVEIPHTSIQGIKLENDVITDSTGVATFSKYEANGNKYAYYLVETKAPTGYNILDSAKEVHFTDADVVATKGIYTVEVENSSGLTLPITGGEGIVFFSVIGIVFMGGAVFLFVISRKKSKTKCKK